MNEDLKECIRCNEMYDADNIKDSEANGGYMCVQCLEDVN